MAHLKGQNVNLLIGGSVIAASTSADFSITANSTDAASKSDANPLWDNPEFTYYDWSASNESFICDIASLKTLIETVATGTATVQVQFQVGTSSTDKLICKKGTAIITSLEVDAPADDYAKLSISLEGASALTDGTWATIETASSSKIRGKALMLAIVTGTGDTASYGTVCAATGHKLSISVQTSDTKTKDDNDKAISKDVTGKSLTLSTDNLVDIHDTDPKVCWDASELLEASMAGTALTIQFGYYPSSIGAAVTADDGYSWNAPETLLITGSYLCTSFSISGQNKEDSSMSAEFSLCGSPVIAS